MSHGTSLVRVCSFNSGVYTPTIGIRYFLDKSDSSEDGNYSARGENNAPAGSAESVRGDSTEGEGRLAGRQEEAA
jgi:hypothetical protein